MLKGASVPAHSELSLSRCWSFVSWMRKRGDFLEGRDVNGSVREG
jgi:hypothetical protein